MGGGPAPIMVFFNLLHFLSPLAQELVDLLPSLMVGHGWAATEAAASLFFLGPGKPDETLG